MSQFPPLRIVRRPISSNRSSAACGQLSDTDGVKGCSSHGYKTKHHSLKEGKAGAVTLICPQEHVGIALPIPCSDALTFSECNFAGRDVQKGVFQKVRRNPVCRCLKKICRVRRELQRFNSDWFELQLKGESGVGLTTPPLMAKSRRSMLFAGIRPRYMRVVACSALDSLGGGLAREG